MSDRDRAHLEEIIDQWQHAFSARLAITGAERVDGYYIRVEVPDSGFVCFIDDSPLQFYFLAAGSVGVTAELSVDAEAVRHFLLRLGRVDLFLHESTLFGKRLGRWLEFADGYVVSWDGRKSFVDRLLLALPGYREHQTLLVG